MGRHLLWALLLAPWTGFADPIILVPPGLLPGDHYRLVFVTASTTDAISTSIADYDTFVNNEANDPLSLLLPLGVTWTAIGSTSTVAAYDHIGGVFSTPIYRLDGALVAIGSAGLWDGSLDAPIRYSQFGTDVDSLVWTGSAENDGSIHSCSLGSSYSCGVVGLSGTATNDWLAYWLESPLSVPHPLYGISPDLTVPGSGVPEPGTVSMMLMGAMLVLLTKRYLRIP